MKKQILSLALAVVMLFGVTGVSAQDWSEPTPLNIYDNELFEIVGEIREVSKEEVNATDEIFDIYYSEESKSDSPLNENGVPTLKTIKKITTYTSGARVTEHYADIGFTEYISSISNEYTNHFTKEDETEKCLISETNRHGETTIRDIYVLAKEGDDLGRSPFLSEETISINDGHLYNLYSFEVVDGEIVRNLLNENPMTVDEYHRIKYGSEFNDGLDFNQYGYYDINGNMIFEDLMVSYYYSDYNLGYFFESSNNGDTLDWNDENAYSKRIFSAAFEDISTGEKYFFENASMEVFNDKGYTTLYTKDAEGNDTGYIVKLKKPAIVTVFLNGRKIRFDQLPVIDNGRTLVPLRAIFENLGAEIEWNETTKTVTAVKNETKIELTIDSINATKNGENVTLDVPAKIVNGRTLVPVRFVADCFGVDVEWNEAMKQVSLTEK